MTTEILARVHTATRTPVVFVAGTVNYEARTIQSWIKGEPQTVSLNYYHETGPLSAADEEILRKRYATNFNDPEVRVRHRLPRTTPERENIIAKPGRKSADGLTSVERANLKAQEKPTQALARRADDKAAAPVAQPAPATITANTPTPQQIWEAIEAHRVESMKQIADAMEELKAMQQVATPNRAARRRAQPAKKATARKATSKSRSPKAKPIQTKV